MKMKYHIGCLATALALGFTSTEAHAERWVFSSNHTDLEWKTLETEHFAFHYPVSKKKEGNEHYLTAEYSAGRFATVAEENWHDMCAEFNYFLKEKIHVLVVNQGDDLEGFTIPTWDWIVMSANPGGGMFSYSRGRMEWFSTVFAHEFAHVVSLKANAAHAEPTFLTALGGLYNNGINYGNAGSSLNHSSIGIEIPIGDSDSVWWVEGGAEFWSGSTNVNWWTSARDRTVRSSVLEDRLLTYPEWQTRMGKSQTGWNEGERYYQGGHSFALYIRERFGHRVFAQFALEYGKAWRPSFETVVEDVTGVDSETLYYDWKEFITKKYNSQYDRVKAKGEVVGTEMIGFKPEWEYKNPKERDTWLGDKVGVKERGWFGKKTSREREAAKEGTGRWTFEPRVSPDGKYFGSVNRGAIVISPADRALARSFTGVVPSDKLKLEKSSNKSFVVPYGGFDHGWDFVPGQDAIVLTGKEDSHPKNVFSTVTQIDLNLDGYNWNEIYLFKYPNMVTEKHGNRTIKRRMATKGYLKKKMWDGEWNKVPNTKRGSDPAVSPDGKRMAFLQYTDGTINLATINLDGSDKKLLTNYSDGTWMRIVDWSPDGKQLVLMLFRNFQQNLYTVNADGSDLKPIMMDEWEEQDPHWSATDGKIYFSADPDGISNIFSYDPANGEFVQITNVINGAYSPQITNDGDLVYHYYTANGWKIYGIPKNQFLNENASHLFNTNYGEAHASDFLKETLDYSHFDAMTSKYSPLKSISSPVLIPIYRLENDSTTNWGMQGGGQFQLMDYAQFNQLFGFFLLGEDSIFQMGYTNDMLFATWFVYAGYFQGKFDQGFLLDQDQNPETSEDQKVYEIKRNQSQRFGGFATSYTWNSRFSTTLGVRGFDFGLKSIDSTTFEPFMWSITSELTGRWSNNGWLARNPNPYYGRTIDFTLSHSWTDIVYEAYGGVTIDDGEELDAYEYNSLELRWTENYSIPTFGSKFLKEARKRKHVIQVDAQVGVVDRNVSGNDEFRAGGRHPYNFGYGSIQPNTQFAGYPSFSLSGETMMIMNMAYRFPITRPEQNWLIGPLYLYGVYAQFSGTAGNLWSFVPPSNPSEFYRSRFEERIAYDKADIKREIPFRDVAYKNGNRMLYDAAFEVRVNSGLYHTQTWDSFVRLAYGFNAIRGFGDVDGDDIFDTNDSALGDELSSEVEPAGFRFYLGLGTGW
jgi:Tol biopolymer transport system component